MSAYDSSIKAGGILVEVFSSFGTHHGRKKNTLLYGMGFSIEYIWNGDQKKELQINPFISRWRKQQALYKPFLDSNHTGYEQPDYRTGVACITEDPSVASVVRMPTWKL